MQQGLQFCNVNHAMVALDLWFPPIKKSGRQDKFQLITVHLRSQYRYQRKHQMTVYIYEATTCEVPITTVFITF